MTKRPTVRDLRTYLADKPPPELIAEIVELFKQHAAVREFYALRMGAPPDQDLLERHKAIITREFFPPGMRPGPGRLSVARRAVLDYKKLAAAPAPIADIMLHYVETGVAYMRAYGYESDSFYSSMSGMYADAIRHIQKHHLEPQLQDRCKQIMRSLDGWGFQEALMEIYYSYLEIPDDDLGEE